MCVFMSYCTTVSVDSFSHQVETAHVVHRRQQFNHARLEETGVVWRKEVNRIKSGLYCFMLNPHSALFCGMLNLHAVLH